MKILRLSMVAAILTVLILAPACKASKNTEQSGSKTFTVTMKNIGAFAVNIYIEGQVPNDGNLVAPGGAITASVTIPRIGHRVSFYVSRDGLVLDTINCIVAQASWDSQNSEVQWDGVNITCTIW